MDKPTTKDVARFFDKFQITEHCWPWNAGKSRTGYGSFQMRERSVKVHRFSYELFIGQIPEGMHVLHKRECGNRSCVNPNHLYAGTHQDNMRDREEWGNPADHRGEAHGGAKLTNEDVLEIRRLYNLPISERPSQRILGKKFGVTKSLIRRIVHHQGWMHLP